MTLPKLTSPRAGMAELMLLATAAVWGSSYGVAKQALVFYPLAGFLALRFCITFALLLPTLRQLNGDTLRAGLPLGLLLLAIFLCETGGLLLTQASSAAFLISLCIVFTPFVDWLLTRRRPPPAAFVVGLVSLFGAWLLAGAGSLALGLGDYLMLMAALLRALMVCLTARLCAGRNVPALPLTAVQAGVVGAGSLLLASVFLKGGLPPLPQAPAFWYATLYLVVFCSIFAMFAQNYSLRHISPTRVTLLTGSEPVFGALFAALWLGERLNAVSWTGAALIVAATLWATLPRATVTAAAPA